MNNEHLLLAMKLYEEKLRSLMPEEEFYAFVTDVFKKTFRAEVNNMPDGAFKQFCIDNFGMITGDPEVDDGK